ncbi:Cell division control protein 6 [Fasciola hepatica]|uniref:Cell division control protein n=1 Tax=Fasciola hepatica TaxID=6192 RepID=A0A4E0QU85_FASHE|nr:Cell division control protein 6 [Fasciola hepatica]
MMLPPRRATLRSYSKAATPDITELVRPKRASVRQHPKVKSCHSSPRASVILNDPSKNNKPSARTSAKLEVATSEGSASPLNCSSVHSDIVGREAERLLVRNFIQSAIVDRRSAALYVSGAPGTGKSAVVLHEARSFEKKRGCHMAVINCMHLRSSSAIFTHLVQSIKNMISGRENHTVANTKGVETLIDRLISQGTLLLILDEVDQLICQSQDVLYRIFNWPEVLKCHVVIIGIANALDLPERLPKLKSKTYQPVHVAFAPYTMNELSAIVSAKLTYREQTSEKDNLDPLAIQLCARKISASTGDVRTALDVCRRAIDLAAQEAKKQNGTSDERCFVRPSLQHISMALKELNGIHQVLQTVTSSDTGGGLRRSEDIPLHHKLLIAGCQLLRQRRGKQIVPFTELYDTYGLICRTHRLIGLGESELVTICGLLESRGYLEFSATKGSAIIKQSTPARFRCVKLRLDDHTVKQLLLDDLFSSILSMSI